MLRGVLKPLRAPPSRLPRRGLATQQAGKEASGSSEGPVAEELEEAAGGWFKVGLGEGRGRRLRAALALGGWQVMEGWRRAERLGAAGLPALLGHN